MAFDWPHMAASAAIIFVMVLLVNKSGAMEGASRGKRALITAVAVFVPLLILNIIWPYGGG